MDEVGVILEGTLSPNPNDRKAAEQRLDEIQYAPNHLPTLLQIIVQSDDDDSDISLRQVAAIHFKNFIAKNWSSSTAHSISFADKDFVRNHILLFLPQLPSLLRYAILYFTPFSISLNLFVIIPLPFHSFSGFNLVSASKLFFIPIIPTTVPIFLIGSNIIYTINNISTLPYSFSAFFLLNMNSNQTKIGLLPITLFTRHFPTFSIYLTPFSRFLFHPFKSLISSSLSVKYSGPPYIWRFQSFCLIKMYSVLGCCCF